MSLYKQNQQTQPHPSAFTFSAPNKSSARVGCWFVVFSFLGIVANGEFYAVSDIVCGASHQPVCSWGFERRWHKCQGNASAVSGLIRRLYLGDKHLPRKIQSSASLSTCSESLERRRHHKQHIDLSKHHVIFSSISIPPPQHTPPSPLLLWENSKSPNKVALPCLTQLISRNTENLRAQYTKLENNEQSWSFNSCTCEPQFGGRAQGSSHTAREWKLTPSCLSNSYSYRGCSCKHGPWPHLWVHLCHPFFSTCAFPLK